MPNRVEIRAEIKVEIGTEMKVIRAKIKLRFSLTTNESITLNCLEQRSISQSRTALSMPIDKVSVAIRVWLGFGSGKSAVFGAADVAA